ncbi:MAG: biopolymer transporter ExbD [Acidobacteria bacterium]|nr:biopolymer transporter ExbD [Acidobacteriota bacterium]
MGMDSGGGGGVKSDINVTPLVDVVLVLLIIFMVVTPMLQKGKDVQLPTTSNPDTKKSDDKNDVLVSVTADGKVWLDTAVVSKEQLTSMMAETYARSPGKSIIIKGDKRLTFGDVKDVMLIVNQAGFTNVAVMADRALAGAAGH